MQMKTLRTIFHRLVRYQETENDVITNGDM